MKYYLIAGEASGDLHGSRLIRAIQEQDSEATFRAWGGDLMQEAGATLAMHYKSIAIMGLVDVLKNLGQIFKNISFCKKDILEFNPDALIFIDFSGFNLRIAPWAKKAGYTTHYYIAPQVWASRAKRVQKIKAHIDQLYVTLPFEPDFYKQHQYPAHYVGHPLLEIMQEIPPLAADWLDSQGLLSKKPIIALLPGSRKQEIKAILPIMAALSHRFPDYEFVLAAAPSIDPEYYDSFIGNAPIKRVFNQTYPLLQSASVALVASGTATLETALLGVPQIVCYKTQWLTYWVAKQIIKLPYISLVNLILDSQGVPELIQSDLNVGRLKHLLPDLVSGAERAAQLKNYERLKNIIGPSGAAKKAAKLIVKHSLAS
ncbi:MAG: lipid-A-disaccharide synthase [Flavobacteriia bacterium]|nr:lipid-A-disaccharide synthase [Flavobacteriia bacterium]